MEVEKTETESEESLVVKESAPKQKTSEKSKKKENLEEKALEKLWRGEAAPKAPKTKTDQTKAEPKKTEIKETMEKPKQTPKKTPKKKSVPDDVYNIEALVEKKGSQYLVLWENYPTDQNTWEPRDSIPTFILKVCLLF